jgi:hypothetical protein
MSFNIDSWSKLPCDMCSCHICGWEGPVKSCERHTESEGWEYPTYYYHTCPVCDLAGPDCDISIIESYWSSILMFFDQAAEEAGYKFDDMVPFSDA